MGKEIITFDNTEIEKNKFQCYKNLIFLNDVDVDNILISNRGSSSKNIYN